jgi:hypothetical protein
MKFDKKTRKYKKEYLELLIEIVNSDDFKVSFLVNNHFNYNDIQYWGISYYDVITNNEMNGLVRKISSLKDKQYKSEVYLVKPKNKNINYFRIQYDNSGYGRLAKIEFLKDDFIQEIRLDYTQITNNEAIVEYQVVFKKVLDIESITKYLESNKETYIQCIYSNYYKTDNYRKKEFMDKIIFYTNDAFIETLQNNIGKITNFGIGDNYSLPSLFIKNVKDELLDEESLKETFLSTLIRIGDQYLHYSVIDNGGLKINLLFTGRNYKPITLIGIASRLRLKFYYWLYSKIEHYEINLRMNKYFGKDNKRIKSNDYKWLVNKKRSFRDNSIHNKYEKDRENYFKEWVQYKNGEITELDLLRSNLSEDFESIYTECLNHINTLYGLQKENLIIMLATLTLALSAIGVVVTIIIGV